MFQSKPTSADAVAPVRAPIRTFPDNVNTTATAQRNVKIMERARPARSRARVERQNAEPNEELLVEKILQAFNTWSFKREQPDSIASLREIIGRAVYRKEPVPFVLYWGKGPRSKAGTPEATCLNFLVSFADRIRGVYEKGADLRLICTDTHAQLNGHPQQAIDDYFASIRVEAERRGFKDCRLSDLVANALALGVEASGDEPDPLTLQKLCDCAAKWYRGEGSTNQGAIEYYRMNMIEKRAVEVAYPHSVFVTFNGSEFRSLFPDRMPVFYMYSLKRGVAVKPWFLPDDLQ